jgi:hypothetical protein
MGTHLLQLPPNANPKYWCKTTCIECGTEFYIRNCYKSRGQGKFCSVSCSVRYRDKHNNPAKKPEARAKISKNHADVSGTNNPMFGMTGNKAPGYIDGRNGIHGDIWRKIALIYKEQRCEICGAIVTGYKLHIHHKDKDRKNNKLENLQVVCARCHNLILHEHLRDNQGRFVS